MEPLPGQPGGGAATDRNTTLGARDGDTSSPREPPLAAAVDSTSRCNSTAAGLRPAVMFPNSPSPPVASKDAEWDSSIDPDLRGFIVAACLDVQHKRPHETSLPLDFDVFPIWPVTKRLVPKCANLAGSSD